jgi:uncharacterized protein
VFCDEFSRIVFLTGRFLSLCVSVNVDTYHVRMATITIAVRVTPRAGRDGIVAWQDSELHVRLKAPPVEGQANEGLKRFLARQLRVPASAVEIVGGATARHKRVRIEGLTMDEIRTRLQG